MKTEKRRGGVSINRSVDLWPADDRKRGLSWGMPLLFSIQGGNEFLVIFQKRCPRAQAAPLRGSETEIDRGVSWCGDEHFLRFWCAPLRRGSVSKRLDEDGLALKRFGDGASFSVGRPSSLRPRTYCVVIWCPCWRVMKKSHRLALNACDDFPRQIQSLMRTAKTWAFVCWAERRFYKLYHYSEGFI